MNLLDLDLCNSSQWYNGRIFSTNLCAGYPEGKIDTCQVTVRSAAPRAPPPRLRAALQWPFSCIESHNEAGR